MMRLGSVSLLALVSVVALSAPSRASDEIVIAAITPVIDLGGVSAPSLGQGRVDAVFAAVAPGADAPSTPRTASREMQVALGPDGQAYIPSNITVQSRALGPVAGGAVYAGFFLPYEVRDAEARYNRKLQKPTTSSEMVTAWTSTVVLGIPTATRTSVDQWVAAAYLMGPRRR